MCKQRITQFYCNILTIKSMSNVSNYRVTVQQTFSVLHGGTAVGRWTCDSQVTGSSPGWSVFMSRNRSTQPCIPPGSLNQVSTLAGGKGGIHTSTGWQVTVCDLIWHVSSP